MRALIAGAGILALTLVGCGDDIKNYVHCHEVCDRYQECAESSFDVNGCASRCSDKAGDDLAYSRSINECNACQETRSCAEAAVCLPKCPNVAID